MGNEFNKTEADFAYERYSKMGSISPEQDIPTNDIRPVGTITAQSSSEGSTEAEKRPVESALTSHKRIGATPVDFDGVVDDGADPVLVGDEYLAADIGLNVPESELGRRADREGRILASPAPERDDLLESDAVLAAGAAGLTGDAINYANEDEESVDDDGLDEEDDELPLEDIPDADDIEAGTPIDPVSPPVDAMPGTDVLNGSNGDEEA